MSRLVAVLAIVFACACGGDDDGGDGGDGVGDDGGDDTSDDGGPDSSTALSELSAAEATDLCEAIDALLDDSILDLQTVSCYLGGILKGGDCEGYVETCLSAEPPAEQVSLDCGEILIDTELPACAADVTVGDLEDCFAGFFDLWAGLADEITCDSEFEDFNDQLSEIPPACETLFELCPDL